MVKKIIAVALLLVSFYGFSQKIKIEKDLKFLSVNSYKVENSFFNVLEVKNIKSKKYEYSIYALKDSISNYVNSFESDVSQNIEAYYKANDVIKVVLSSKKVISIDNNDKNKIVYSDYLRDYKILSINLIDKVIHEEKLEMEEPDAIVSSTDYACFLYANRRRIKIRTFSENKINESEMLISKEIKIKYNKLKFSDLKVIPNEIIAENIGTLSNRIFYDNDNLYVTYLSPKLRSSLVFKFDRNGNNFVESGYNELDFGFDKKVKDYNSFLARDWFYLIAARGEDVCLSSINLKKNII